MKSGVYFIRSPSGRQYIGSSSDIPKRWRQHRSALRNVRHVNSALQRAWAKYGEPAMQFGILLMCAPEHLLVYEQIALDGFAPRYNGAKTAQRSAGWVHKPETKTELSRQRAGVKRGPHSEETKEKMRAAQIGKKRKPISDQHRARLSEFNRERMRDPEVRNHLSRMLTGGRLSEEHKNKIGDANRGRKPTAATLQALSQAHIGKKQSEETKAKRLASYLQTVSLRNGIQKL